jgi:ABC-type dipeptide/oligopeptide/nickel transport system permease component
LGRGAYLVRRTAFALATVFVVITLNFFLFRVLPGSAVTNLSHVPDATPELRHALEVQFGLDKPKWQQYFIYIRELAQGNLGISYTYQQPVATVVRRATENTIPMVLLGTLVGMILGTVSGTVSAWRRGSALDVVNVNVAVAFWAVPTQWLGLLLVIGFADRLPSNGMSDPYLVNPSFGTHLKDLFSHMLLPALTVALVSFGQYAIIVRSAILETFGEDYILTARAKGLTKRLVVVRHALRNAMLPVITLVGLSLGRVVAGVILVETVFSWPGIGLLTYQSVTDRDYPVLQGAFLVIALSVIAFNFLADVAYLFLDPRVTL